MDASMVAKITQLEERIRALELERQEMKTQHGNAMDLLRTVVRDGPYHHAMSNVWCSGQKAAAAYGALASQKTPTMCLMVGATDGVRDTVDCMDAHGLTGKLKVVWVLNTDGTKGFVSGLAY